jgi:hypothetical protein
VSCECERCAGRGLIDCPDCDGEGFLGLEAITLPQSDPRHAELERLKDDASAAEVAARRLGELRPDHRASYQRQLEQTRERIEVQVEELMKWGAA